jgi:glycosyltransferase involved in cell wall biosynthesis
MNDMLLCPLIFLLLHAAKYIIEGKERTDIHFGLVGGGTELEELQKDAEQLGISEYVTFTGRVPDHE